MKIWNLVIALPLLVLVLGACSTQSTRETDASTESIRGTDADNTARNERDRSGEALTSGDQSETEVDREISANIRKAILADDSLSVNAHNVKIITSEQVVTLRGPVKSEQEKETIETKAKQVAGNRSVDNLLEVEVNP